MKNFQMRFATVALTEVLKKAVEVSGAGGSTRVTTNNESHIFSTTCFTDACHEDPKRSTSKAVGGPPRRVLVVGDEQVIVGSLMTILRRAGYEVAVSYDAFGAISECMSFRPELVITDVVISGMNGTEIAIRIQERCPACKMLLFSGRAETAESLEEARRSGYDFKLLERPINPIDLLAKGGRCNSG